MKKILYIGNKLSGHGFNQTGIEMLGPLLENEGFEVVYASSKKNKWLRFLDMFAATVRHSASTNYVLIDTYSTVNFWYAFLISQLCRVLRLKYIPVLHGGDLPKRLRNNPVLCRLIFKNSLVNVAPSGYLLHAFQDKGFAVMLIPNAIDLQKYPFKQREILAPKLLWVRSLAALYNPEMALRVLQELQKNYPDAELCMVGPDKENMLEKLKIQAQKLNITVKFTGKLSKESWIKASESYDVFINTTHYDNMPVSVIEAMALGLVVVSTDVGGLPFLIEHNQTGLLVPDNNPMEMAKCIGNVIKDQDFKAKLVQNAYNVIRQFDQKVVKEQWLEILK